VHAFALRDRCVQRLRGIDVPRPLCLDSFAATVAAQRSRPLRVCDLPGLDAEDAPSGARVATDRCDFVFIDAAASPWHRTLIGLHEIGHVLFDHPAEAGWVDELTAALLPDLRPSAVRRILGRHGYSSRQEAEAELLASLILERAGEESRQAGASPRADLMISRLSAVIEHPLRHG
jgi:hypothetical protein